MCASSATKTRLGRPSATSHQAILDAARELLLSEGERALSMRRIAQQLGVTPPSLYGYFANKEQLLTALAEQLYDGFSEGLDCSRPWPQVLEQWLNNWRKRLSAAPESLFLVGMMATTPRGLRELEAVAELLRPVLGSDEQAVCQAQSLWWTVLSFCSFEQDACRPAVLKHLKKALPRGERASWVQGHLAVESYEQMWRATVARNIAGLHTLAGTGASS